MYLCFECPPAIQCFGTEVNCKLRFVARTRLSARVTSYAVTLRSEMFAGSNFLFLTADILQQYANTCRHGCKHEDSRSLPAREFCKMWRYFDKVSPPPSPEQSSKYEQDQRKRAFSPSWQQNRPWLKYLDAESGQASTSAAVKSAMYCQICQEASKIDRSVQQKHVFVDGCTSLRIESIKIHETSANHVKAAAIIAAMSQPEKTPAFKIISSLNKETLEKLTRLFRTCHALALHSGPYSDYLWQGELDEAKGINLGKTYRTNQIFNSERRSIRVVEYVCKLIVFQGSLITVLLQ